MFGRFDDRSAQAALGERYVAAHSPRRPNWRVAFINTHPIQYFAPLHAYLTRTGIEVTAFYLSDFSIRGGHDRGFGQAVKWDIDLLAGYEAQFLSNADRRRPGGFFSMIAPGLWSAIRRGRFDALVIHGHNLAAHHVALAAALSCGTPVFARSETHLGLKRASWKQAIRTPILSTWYRAFDAFLAIGTGNAKYYEAMGVPGKRIFPMPYAVDNDRFVAAAVAGRSPTERAATRARLGFSGEAPAILFAAKFERRKRPDDLIAAFERLQREGVDARLVMVGSGELERDLRCMVSERAIRNVTFAGFVNQTDLPKVYAACEIFVLPSENEPWGLAVNEAMCAGLPIVVSDSVGCAEDLVSVRSNGATFTAGDVNALADAMRSFLIDEELRGKAGQSSLERISGWSYRECAAGLRAAVEATSRSRSARW